MSGSYAAIRAGSEHGGILDDRDLTVGFDVSSSPSTSNVQRCETATLDASQHSAGNDAGAERLPDNARSPLEALFARNFTQGAQESRAMYLCRMVHRIWRILSFEWMKKLLEIGNKRRLEPDDLYPLHEKDCAEGVYKTFAKEWCAQISVCRRSNAKKSAVRDTSTDKDKEQIPSLARTFFRAFGGPFVMAGGLKLIHDTLLFSGPWLLNRTIIFLGDPSQPVSTGFFLVLTLFLTQFTMSLCLRQYFWWCYRVGMRLRSAVITSVFIKSTALSAGAMSRHSVGEITNLMSVDSTRLQDLTPYLHACWYSLYQLGIALYFLSQQLGLSTIAAVVVILAAIPVTKAISSYMKSIQDRVSKLRDERVKVSNEVFAGMKVIKLQAWEAQYIEKITALREKEMIEQLKYAKAQALSGFIFGSIPQVVAVVTFTVYVQLGNHLDVATALTSFALFDLLRFPLFMLPTVINNIVEASVTIDRVQAFLLESEVKVPPSYPVPPDKSGVFMDKASLLWEGTGKKYSTPLESSGNPDNHPIDSDDVALTETRDDSHNGAYNCKTLANLTITLMHPRQGCFTSWTSSRE